MLKHVLNYHSARIKQRWRRKRKFAVKWKRHKGAHASGARRAATLDFYLRTVLLWSENEKR
jgi:hypothetical protein